MTAVPVCVLQVKDEDHHKLYSTHMDVLMSKEDSSTPGHVTSTSSITQLADGSQRREVEVGGVKIHTASVSTVSDTEETVSNLGSTSVIGLDPLAECESLVLICRASLKNVY